MGTTALWCWHLSFSLLIVATALAWGSRRSSVARRAALALALVPLLVLHAALAWTTLRLRFHLGIGFSPWIAACGLLAVHALGVLLLLARSRREPGAAAWPTGTLAVCSLAAFALAGTTLWNLELQARIEVSRLSLEAGRIAWRESAPRPRSEDNAAPLYLAASQKLQHGDEGVLDPWLPVLRDHANLDANDPKLRTALESLSTALESTREAARRPACWFEPEPSPDSDGLSVVPPPVAALFKLADALELEARVRAADGEVSGALADVEALFALARHVVQEPMLISTLLASSMRSKAVDALAYVLSVPSLAAGDLEALDPAREPSLAAVAPRALAREEAFCLAAIGHLAEPGTSLGGSDGAQGLARNRLASALYKAFMLQNEVAELRSSLKAIQALALSPVAELRAQRSSMASEMLRRGSLASYLMPNMLPVLLALHRSDSELELVGLAVDAARWKLEHGRYPRTLAELGHEGGPALLEGDGTFVRFTRPDDGEAEVRLPPATTPR